MNSISEMGNCSLVDVSESERLKFITCSNFIDLFKNV